MRRLISFVISHPLCREHRLAAIARLIRWQLGIRLLRGSVVVPFTARTRLLVDRGMTGATGNVYCGLHEFADMAFVLHLLRKDDLFVDVGANVGSYTVLASGHVGAHSIAFEPVPTTYRRLVENIFLNQIVANVTTHNAGVGDSLGVLSFTKSLDTMNHVATETDTETIDVEMVTLEQTVKPKPNQTVCIKIDVEGFEGQVLGGANSLLRSQNVLAVLMELNGSGSQYGFSDDQLHAHMLEFGFHPFRYEPFSRELTSLDDRNTNSGNTLYIRDEAEARKRVTSAPVVELPWRTF